jgi:hypothetical protein
MDDQNERALTETEREGPDAIMDEEFDVRQFIGSMGRKTTQALVMRQTRCAYRNWANSATLRAGNPICDSWEREAIRRCCHGRAFRPDPFHCCTVGPEGPPPTAHKKFTTAAGADSDCARAISTARPARHADPLAREATPPVELIRRATMGRKRQKYRDAIASDPSRRPVEPRERRDRERLARQTEIDQHVR